MSAPANGSPVLLLVSLILFDRRGCAAKEELCGISRKACVRSSRNALGITRNALARAFSQAAFDVAGDSVDHRVHMRLFKEVASALDFFMLDRDALLIMQLVNQRGGICGRGDPVGGAVNDQPR